MSKKVHGEWSRRYYENRNIDSETLFFERIDRESVGTGCWVWKGHLSPAGYGHFVKARSECGSVLAHRYSWWLHNGKPNLERSHVKNCILHKCNNKQCCNPDHLYKGTKKDNSRDKNVARTNGMHKVTGTQNCNAKLDWEKVTEIRRSYSHEGMNQYMLADKYGVTQPTIKEILKYRTWKPENDPRI